MKTIEFEKYHGLGNDFLLVDEEALRGADAAALAVKLCARTTGIGADGLIVVSHDAGSPLEMIIFNSDGSAAPMCGNGIRCFAKYALSHGLAAAPSFPVLTGAGEMRVEVVSTEPFSVKINMGAPDFTPVVAGVNADAAEGEDFMRRTISAGRFGSVTVSTLFMGTYHTVVWMDSTPGLPAYEDEDGLKDFGREVQGNGVFAIPQNVNMATPVGENEIRLITYERGAGLTDACGTGACATAVVAHGEGLTGTDVRVRLKHGDLDIALKDGRVYMTGPAVLIAKGIAYA